MNGVFYVVMTGCMRKEFPVAMALSQLSINSIFTCVNVVYQKIFNKFLNKDYDLKKKISLNALLLQRIFRLKKSQSQNNIMPKWEPQFWRQ
jgi:hypothetical protein